MKNRILGYILLFILSFSAQSAISQGSKVEDMRSKAKAMRKEIEQKEAILTSSKNDINSEINNLKIVSAQISEYEKLEKQLKKEIKAIDDKITKTDNRIKEIVAEIEIKDREVKKSSEEYAEALRKARKYSNFENKLLFIFSAEDFSTMTRRYRYTNNYMNAHKALADSLKMDLAELESKKKELQSKKDELNRAKASKATVKKEQEAERAKIIKKKKERESIIASLEKKKSKVEAELKKQRNEYNRLQASIQKEIARIVAEEEAKKKEQEKAKAKAKAEAEAKAKAKSKSKGKAKGKADDKKASKAKEQDTSSYNKETGAEKMSGTFEKNKGKMTIPITGAYLIVDQFGERNAVGTKGSVMINNGGLTFKGTKGAKARTIFDGTVSTVFYHNDYICVLIRHDKYISVYCNLKNVKVKSGQKVKNGEIIGEVAADAEDGNPSMLFQLYREKTLLNPSDWLKL